MRTDPRPPPRLSARRSPRRGGGGRRSAVVVVVARWCVVVVVVVVVRGGWRVIDTRRDRWWAAVVAGRGVVRRATVGGGGRHGGGAEVARRTPAGRGRVVVALDLLAEHGGLGGRARWPAARAAVAVVAGPSAEDARDQQQPDAERDGEAPTGARCGARRGVQVGGHVQRSVPQRPVARQRSPEFRASPLRDGRRQRQDHTVVITDVVVAGGSRPHRTAPSCTVPPLGGHVQIPISIEPDDRSWQDYANCLGVDPDLFFPERGASTREAKEVCRGLRRAGGLPRVRPGQRREVRHLGRHERARATPPAPPAGARPPGHHRLIAASGRRRSPAQRAFDRPIGARSSAAHSASRRSRRAPPRAPGPPARRGRSTPRRRAAARRTRSQASRGPESSAGSTRFIDTCVASPTCRPSARISGPRTSAATASRQRPGPASAIQTL